MSDNQRKPAENRKPDDDDLLQRMVNFSWMKEISRAREGINAKLDEILPKGNSQSESVTDRLKDKITAPLYEASEYCQKNYPWPAAVTRSHSPEIIAAYTVGSFAFCWKFTPKYKMAGTVSGALYAIIGTTIINYKWYFPKDEK